MGGGGEGRGGAVNSVLSDKKWRDAALTVHRALAAWTTRRRTQYTYTQQITHLEPFAPPPRIRTHTHTKHMHTQTHSLLQSVTHT